MEKYVQGFVLAVPTEKREAFRKHAAMAAPIFREHGALQVMECWGDEVPDGEVTSFPMAVKKRDDETVVFSWIVWPSKTVHDEGMRRIMEDPRLSMENNPMPFDGKRMIWGGFVPVVEE